MPKKKKHLTRKNAKAKAKVKARGKADIVPFLLAQKLGNLTNKQKQTTLKNILSNLPKQGVEDAITQQELALKELAEKPRPYQIPPLTSYNYPFQSEIPRGYEYNYPLVKLMANVKETALIDSIYGLKRDAELPSNFLKTLFANFLKLTKQRRKHDYILTRIPDYELQQVLTTQKFFIIDFDFLSNALEISGPKLTNRGSYSGTSKYTKGNNSVNASKTKKFKSYTEYIIKKIKNTIFDPLVIAYRAFWAIKYTTKIIIDYYGTLRGRQPDPRPSPSIYDFPIEDPKPNFFGHIELFKDVWHHTNVGVQKYKNALWDFANGHNHELVNEPFYTPEVTNVHVYDVLLFYILELNKSLEYLATYRISIVRELLDIINSDLLYIDNKIASLYGKGLIRGVAPNISALDVNRPVFRIEIPELPELPELP